MLEQDVDDVSSEESSVVVDCDVLEAAKENVQPLVSGRRVTALSAILQTPHGLRETKLSATRKRLRINVDIALDDPDDDPLEAYCRLIYWTVENYPQGHSAESGLLELLEEATRKLKDDRGGQWRAELKYLKLWVLYASFVEKPVVIYKFLLANEIGTDWALFYEEYATVLERNGMRKDADAVYSLGIARQASPLDRLKNRHREFQKRMMSAALPAAPPPEVAPPPTGRTVLGEAGPSSLASSSSSSSTPSLPPRENTRATPTTTTNRRLQVFVDSSSPDAQSAEIQTNAWPELGGRKVRIKENVPEVKKMAGTTIRQPGRSTRIAAGTASGAGTASQIVPYRDPDPEMPPPPPVRTSKKSAAVPKTPAKGLAVFRDGDEEIMQVPSTPKFTPFRDNPAEMADPTTSATGLAAAKPDTVMKAKTVVKAGRAGPAPVSEAEALRKDPLKNYGTMGLESR